MTAPNPFPYEDAEHQLPTRPPVRRPTHAGDWADIEARAAKLRAVRCDCDEQATPSGDPIMRAVTAAALALGVIFLMAAVTRSTWSGTVMLGCILTGIGVCGAGWAAYAITDRKNVEA